MKNKHNRPLPPPLPTTVVELLKHRKKPKTYLPVDYLEDVASAEVVTVETPSGTFHTLALTRH